MNDDDKHLDKWIIMLGKNFFIFLPSCPDWTATTNDAQQCQESEVKFQCWSLSSSFNLWSSFNHIFYKIDAKNFVKL